MFDDYAYYSKKEIVSDVEQPVYGTNDRGKEEKQYAMGVLSLPSSKSNNSGGTSTNPGTDNDNTYGIVVTSKDIFDASSARKADMLKAIGDYYEGPWYDDQDGTHHFNSYGFTPLMMATQAQCYESMRYIRGKIDNRNYKDTDNIKALYNAAYQKHEKITDDDSSARSAVKIAQDNTDQTAIDILIDGIIDYVAEIKYKNSKHTDLKIQLPASETAFKDDYILLPSITGKYVSTNEDEPIRWEPKRWRISKSNESIESGEDYSFNKKYQLNSNATAVLICDKAHVTLTYSFGDVQTNIELPNSVTIQSGSKITLGKSAVEYTDKDKIRWKATGWTIDESGEFYKFNSEYTIYDDTVAILKLERAPVTLTYIDENNLGFNIDQEQVLCGDSITLQTLGENGKYTADNSIVWDLLGWTIDNIDYGFGTEYRIYENTNAYLNCEKATVSLTFTSEYLHIPIPSPMYRKSGTVVILPSVSEYIDENAGKIYKPLKWNISGLEYEFSAKYTIYTDTTATLIYTVTDVPVGIIFSKDSITLTEGNFTQLKFKLESKPRADVILSLDSDSYPDRLAISPSSLTFTTSDWYIEQTVTLTVVDNSIDDGNTSTTVSISALSSDERYNALHTETLSVTINDNDTAGIDYSNSTMTLVEGNSITRTFRLKSEPTNNVTLNITSNNARLGISPSSITFTPYNWNTYKSVTLTAINNNTADGDTTVTVSISTSTSDSKYIGLTGSFTVNIAEDDTANIGTLAFKSGAFTVEFVDNTDTQTWSVKSSSDNVTYDTKEYRIKDQWYSVYNEGYTVEQVPKSPYYSNTDTNKRFEYDLLYNDNKEE
jgi:hypothetical protein